MNQDEIDDMEDVFWECLNALNTLCSRPYYQDVILQALRNVMEARESPSTHPEAERFLERMGYKR